MNSALWKVHQARYDGKQKNKSAKNLPHKQSLRYAG
jgi:hypothetical protein